MTSASFPLSDAPRLLVPELWAEFCSHYSTEQEALHRLSSQLQNYFMTVDTITIKDGQDFDGKAARTVENIERGRQIVALVKEAFRSKQWVATAFQPPALQRVEISPGLWSDLKPIFKLSRAENQDYTFTLIEIYKAVGEREDRVARCRAWLEQQPQRQKKIMLPAAQAHISGLVTREFDAAYSAAYKTKPGRPQKSAP